MKSRVSSGARDEKAKAVIVAKLLAGFPEQRQGDGAAALRAEAYLDAVADLPAGAVEEARVRIVRGDTEHDRFAPTPAQLAKLARAVVAPALRELAELRGVLQAIGGDADPTEAERERVATGFAKLRLDLAGGAA